VWDSRHHMLIATIRGIPIKTHAISILILMIFTLDFTQDARSYGLRGLDIMAVVIGSAALMIVSVFGQESGRLALANFRKARERKSGLTQINLAFLGGQPLREQPPASWSAAVVASLVGPLFHILCGWGLRVAGFEEIRLIESLIVQDPISGIPAMDVLLTLFGSWSIYLGIINLIPALPLDGGYILSATIHRAGNEWHRALLITARIGVLFLAGMLFFCLLNWAGISNLLDTEHIRTVFLVGIFVVPVSYQLTKQYSVSLWRNLPWQGLPQQKKQRQQYPRTTRTTHPKRRKRPRLHEVPDISPVSEKPSPHPSRQPVEKPPWEIEIENTWIRATHYADQRGNERVGSGEILLAVIAQERNLAAAELRKQHITFQDIWQLLEEDNAQKNTRKSNVRMENGREVIDHARKLQRGNVGVFLALKTESEAAWLLSQLGVDLVLTQQAITTQQ